MADPILRLSGIYRIRHIESGRCYVGSAVKFSRRWSRHKTELKMQKHRCKPLERAWAKYGPEAFVFEVLEIVPDVNDLTVREQHWIDTLLSHVDHGGYNVCPRAESRLGMKMSAEARTKIGNAHRGRKATDQARAAIVRQSKSAGRTKTPRHHARKPRKAE